MSGEMMREGGREQRDVRPKVYGFKKVSSSLGFWKEVWGREEGILGQFGPANDTEEGSGPV